MIQIIVNGSLGLGYVLGTILVWIGIEMYAIDGARVAPSLLSVAVGIALWAMLVQIGRALRPRLKAIAAKPDNSYIKAKQP